MSEIESIPFEESLSIKAYFSKIIQLSKHVEDQMLYSFILFELLPPSGREYYNGTIKEGVGKNLLDEEYLKIIIEPNSYLLWTKKVRADIIFFKNKNKDLGHSENMLNDIIKKSFLSYLRAAEISDLCGTKALVFDIMNDKHFAFLKELLIYYLGSLSETKNKKTLKYNFEKFKKLAMLQYDPDLMELEDYLGDERNMSLTHLT